VLTALGVVAVLAGIFAFGSRSSHEVHVNLPSVVRPASVFEDGFDIEVPVPDLDIKFERGFPFHSTVEHDRMPKWMLISLGTILVIVGSLLAGRERTRPVAMKAFTVLGIAAIGYSLFSFFGSPPRSVATRDHDRVVRVSRDEPASTIREHVAKAVDKAVEKVTEKARRLSRAKRPSSRPERPTNAEARIESLPPRAGSIPVEAELAKAEANARPEAGGRRLEDSRSESEQLATPAPAPATTPAAQAPAEGPAAPVSTQPEATAAAPAPPAAAPETAATPDKPADAVEKPAVPENPASEKIAPPEKPTAPPVSGAVEKPTSEVATAPPSPVKASQARPAWVDAHAKLVESVYSISVSSGPFVSVPECQHELDRQIKLEADHYIDEYLGERASQLVKIPLSYLKRHVKKSEYGEIVVSESVGPMHQIHALLEFDEQARADFQRQWHDAIVTDRLWYTGSGAALVLALLGTFYGYLRLDLRTGGSNKGRLQLAATLVALIVAAGALLFRWAVPF
jgi:hypothetical protein